MPLPALTIAVQKARAKGFDRRMKRKNIRANAKAGELENMEKGGKYKDGGRKPLKKLKGAIQKANYKAGEVKNRLEKKVLDAVKRKKAEKAQSFKSGGRPTQDENYKRSTKQRKRGSKSIETMDRSDMLPSRKVAYKTNYSGKKPGSNVAKRVRIKEVDAGKGTITKKKYSTSDRKDKKRGYSGAYDKDTTKVIGQKRAGRIVKRYGKQQERMEKRKANLDKKRDRYS